MTTQVLIFLLIVTLIFLVLLYSSIKTNREIEAEKRAKQQAESNRDTDDESNRTDNPS